MTKFLFLFAEPSRVESVALLEVDAASILFGSIDFELDRYLGELLEREATSWSVTNQQRGDHVVRSLAWRCQLVI